MNKTTRQEMAMKHFGDILDQMKPTKQCFLTGARLLLACALVFSNLRSVQANAPGAIITVAGTDINGKLSTAIGIEEPSGSAIDSTGNLYVTDVQKHRILKVDSGTGLITIVAGNGTQGYSGDGGTATSAQLKSPYGIAVDNAGNLFVADSGNDRIRKVAATTGLITTVAGNGTRGYLGDGGAATSARLNLPYGIAVDSAGNIFFTDRLNHCIRKVTATTGLITTVAGNGTQGYSGDGAVATSAKFSHPQAILVDNIGNLFIADSSNNRIRKVDSITGLITTVAGNGTQGYSGDGGGATSAQLFLPSGIAMDSAGNLFVADSYNNRIRKVDSTTGLITTVAGNGILGYSGDGGVATNAQLYRPQTVLLDSAGDLFVVDTSNHRIRKVTATTGHITTVVGNGTSGYSGDGGPATNAQLYRPKMIAVDNAGNLFVVDTFNHRIRKVTATTGHISTVAGNGTRGYSGDGGAATSAQLSVPNGIALDSVGNLFIADSSNHRIRKVDTITGIISTVVGNGTPGYSGDGGAATSAQLGAPNGIALDSTGNLFVADTYNHRIRKVTATTGLITTVAGNGTLGYSGDGGAATSAKLYQPQTIVVDSAGNIFIADSGNNRIRKVAATTGLIMTVAGNGTQGYSGDGGAATSSQLSGPNGIEVDRAGNLFVADSNNNRIRKVASTTGIITTVAGNGTPGYSGDGGAATSAQLSGPDGIDLDSAGNLFVADSTNDRIRKIFNISNNSPQGNDSVPAPANNRKNVLAVASDCINPWADSPDSSIDIYNGRGQRVKSLTFSDCWNGTLDDGQQVAPGVYMWIGFDAKGKILKMR